MTEYNINNNSVFLQGEVLDEPVYSHTVMDEDFYSFNLKVLRLSGNDDVLPITISEYLLQNVEVGKKIAVHGQFRSFNKLVDGKSRLILSVFCREVGEFEGEADANVIELNGYICKPPIFRNTPLSREICDLLLAVNRNYNKSDYIPCIAWGRNAQFVNSLQVGARIKLSGRIQSRPYVKKLEGSEQTVNKIAYEVSIGTLTVVCQDNVTA